MSSTEVPASPDADRVFRKITMDSGAVYQGWLDPEDADSLNDVFRDGQDNRAYALVLYDEKEGGVRQLVLLVWKKIESVEHL